MFNVDRGTLGSAIQCHLIVILTLHLFSSRSFTPVSVNKPPSVIAAWQALNLPTDLKSVYFFVLLRVIIIIINYHY